MGVVVGDEGRQEGEIEAERVSQKAGGRERERKIEMKREEEGSRNAYSHIISEHLTHTTHNLDQFSRN